MRPASRSSPRLRRVAACAQQSGTIALASQKAMTSAIGAVFADGRGRSPDGDRSASRAPEGSGQWALRLTHEAGRDERRVLLVFVHGQRHDLRDRPFSIANDDFFARAHFAQVLREPVSELGDVRSAHRETSFMAIIAILAIGLRFDRRRPCLLVRPRTSPSFSVGLSTSLGRRAACLTVSHAEGSPAIERAHLRGWNFGRVTCRGRTRRTRLAEMPGRVPLMSNSASFGLHSPHIRRRRYTDDRLEVADEVRLIAVTQLDGERGLIRLAPRGKPFGSLVKSVALNHPFRTDASVSGEQSLQRTFVDAKAIDEIVDPENAVVVRHSVDELVHVADVRIGVRPARTKKPFGN